jgi:hypothetical protein
MEDATKLTKPGGRVGGQLATPAKEALQGMESKSTGSADLLSSFVVALKEP